MSITTRGWGAHSITTSGWGYTWKGAIRRAFKYITLRITRLWRFKLER